MSKYSEQGGFVVWDHETPLWSRKFDKAFDNIDAIHDYFDDSYNIEDELKEEWDAVSSSNHLICEFLQLYCMEPICFPEFELPDWLYEELPENLDSIYDVIPQDHAIFQGLQELNEFIYKQKYILWYEPAGWKPIPESLTDPDYRIGVNIQPRRKPYESCNTTINQITW